MAQLFSRGSKASIGNWDFNSIFERHYEILRTPLCLCSGLEILAANSAFARVLGYSKSSIIGQMLNTFLPTQECVESLFKNPDETRIIEIRGSAGETLKHVSVQAEQWPHDSNLWLLTWQDLSLLESAKSKLLTAQSRDSITGALFADTFLEHLSERLAHNNS